MEQKGRISYHIIICQNPQKMHIVAKLFLLKLRQLAHVYHQYHKRCIIPASDVCPGLPYLINLPAAAHLLT